MRVRTTTYEARRQNRPDVMASDRASWVTRSMSKNNVESKESCECPTCSDSFQTERRMKIHHSQVHGESISGERVECTHCGDDFRVEPWRAEESTRLFCSDECRGGWMTGRTGEDAKRWIGDEAVHECEWCGDEFRRQPSQTACRFCDQECYQEWKEETGREEHECEICGEEFTTQKATDHKGRFCSYECVWRWRSENDLGGPRLTGKDHPQYAGGYEYYYGPSWYEQRRRALDRDNHECQVCGRSDDVHVHHIRPFREFGVERHEEANALNNLVCLCPEHHAKWEGIPLRPEVV